MSRYMTVSNLPVRAAGDTWPIDLALTDGAGAAIDITGYTFTLAVNDEENPADPEASNVISVAGAIVDADAGTFRFAIEQADADALVPTATPYWFSVRMANAGGDSATIMKGRLPVTGSIA
jgi:hypothetical protein